jgi:dienelactone hydrolase
MTRAGGTRRSRDEPSRFEYARVDLTFPSGDGRCGAWLYRPESPRRPRLVVTAPGLLPDRRAVAPVARRYAARGYAVLLFAPRHAAESEEDRASLLIPGRLARDWSAALDYAATLDDVRGRLPVLRGRWLAGHLALRVAAERRIGTVVARSPLLDGRRLRGGRPRRTTLRLLAAGLRDRLPLSTRTVPVAADPATPALYHGRDLVRALDRQMPDGAASRVPARSALALARLSPPPLDDVRVPALVTAAAADPIADPTAVADAVDALGAGTLLRHPGDGLAGVGAPDRDPVLAHEFAFLDEHAPA